MPRHLRDQLVPVPGAGVTVKKDRREFQGPPSLHYSLAKSAGYDFCVTTDHSQETPFQPAQADNPQWMAAKRDATAASADGFVALAGIEYSENDGPGGMGHFNVINSDGILNALSRDENVIYTDRLTIPSGWPVRCGNSPPKLSPTV